MLKLGTLGTKVKVKKLVLWNHQHPKAEKKRPRSHNHCLEAEPADDRELPELMSYGSVEPCTVDHSWLGAESLGEGDYLGPPF